ncbi:MAG: carboxypeptidase regulatory-like domain-containing protein [Acidobacteriota bacterium]
MRVVKIFLCLLLFVLFTSIAFAQSAGELSLRRVTLYRHGVGYFERHGKVNGDRRLSFSFDETQINDVLKSLVVLDLSNGKISEVSIDSKETLERRLGAYAVALDRSNAAGMTSLLAQLKGARIEVSARGAILAGNIVGMEKRPRVISGERGESLELVLISESGQLRSVALDQIRAIRLLDSQLREDILGYLETLRTASERSVRHLTINATGEGEREIVVGYLVETPVWKTTYRMVTGGGEKPFLQGWAIIDNVQGEDWNNVQLSLVAGMPVSFIHDLQQPRYKRRPIVGTPDDYSPQPQLHAAAVSKKIDTLALLTPGISNSGSSIAGKVTDYQGAVIGGAEVTARNRATGVERQTETDDKGEFSLTGLPAGSYDLEVESEGFKRTLYTQVAVERGNVSRLNVTLEVANVTETVTVTAGKEELLQKESSVIGRVADRTNIQNLALSESADVSAQEIGELFEYRIDHPVTIKRNSSALIPVIQSRIEAERVSLYNADAIKQHPMSALYLTNSTGLTLEGGPVTVIEDGSYAGEALMGRVKAGERRFISYAVDLGCRVSVEKEDDYKDVHLVEIIHGEFRLHRREMRKTVYRVANVTDREKSVIIEHPIDDGGKWKMVSTDAPVESTEKHHRFRVTVKPASVAEFTVKEESPDVTTYQLSNMTSDNITVFAESRYLTEEMKQSLDRLTEMKGRIADLGRQIKEKREAINRLTADQSRLRENIRALGKSAEEQKLLARYVAKLSSGEDEMERLRSDSERLSTEQSELQRGLDDFMRRLALNHRLDK